MKKNINLVTLGCSWTDQYDTNINPWPKVIQEKTGWNVVNYGLSGSGNKYAFDKFIIHIKKIGIPDKLYWLITEFDRIDIISQEHNNGTTSFRPNSWASRFLSDGTDKFEENKKIQYEKAAILWHTRNPDATEDQIELFNKSINRDWKILEDLVKITDYQLVTDYNLDLIYKMQFFCKHYNIELKIIAALAPFKTYRDLQESKAAKIILKSRFFKKIDPSTIIGWPFALLAGGICVRDIKDWGSKYGIQKHDDHPNQAGSNLIADFFLDEKNILDYR
jgi:hypothetical protein